MIYTMIPFLVTKITFNTKSGEVEISTTQNLKPQSIKLNNLQLPKIAWLDRQRQCGQKDRRGRRRRTRRRRNDKQGF